MIDLKNIAFHYSKHPLFSELSMNIPKGNIYGLLGMNGAGKTTLLKLIAGQLFIQDGSADVLGFDPKARDPKMLEDIFYLPEEFHLPAMTAKEYIAINAPFYPRFSIHQFDRYAQAFDLDLEGKLSQLSFGQKKKLLLSFGLASNTSLLILDEPTNGLDIPSKSQFRRTVASAMTDDRCFIISTHQVRDMENLIDPIIILHRGKIVFDSPLASVAEHMTQAMVQAEPADADCIYKEKVPGGWSVLTVRKPGTPETAIDLETLFNAITTRPDALTALMTEGGNA